MKRNRGPDKEICANNKKGRTGRRKRTLPHHNQPLAPPSMAARDFGANEICHHPERSQSWSERKRLFLGVGDEVTHLRYEEWGIGVVMEVMTSSVPGGTCLVRVRFQDGQLRCFNNDLDNETCCYYFGVRRYWNPSRSVNALRAKFFELKE